MVFGLVLFLTLGTVQAVVDVDVGGDGGDVAITSTDADPNSGMIRDSEEEEQETEGGEREAKTGGEVPTADPESNTDMKETDEPVLYMGTDADTDDDMAREEAAGGDNNWLLIIALGGRW